MVEGGGGVLTSIDRCIQLPYAVAQMFMFQT